MQGDVVRQLKSSKADKALITTNVQQLLKLKEQLKAMEENQSAKKEAEAVVAGVAADAVDIENLSKQVTEQVWLFFFFYKLNVALCLTRFEAEIPSCFDL